MYLSENNCLETAVHHFNTIAPSLGGTPVLRKITLATDIRVTKTFYLTDANLTKITKIAKKIKLPTAQLVMIAAMMVAEAFEEGTDEQITLIKSRFE